MSFAVFGEPEDIAGTELTEDFLRLGKTSSSSLKAGISPLIGSSVRERYAYLCSSFGGKTPSCDGPSQISSIFVIPSKALVS